jgi:hypothetical protein
MTDLPDRIRRMAERVDTEPPARDLEAALHWDARCDDRGDLLKVATPGALLGALVDLFDFALAGKGWRLHLHQRPFDDEWHVALDTPQQAPFAPQDWRMISRTGPTAAAALLAAMEDL